MAAGNRFISTAIATATATVQQNDIIRLYPFCTKRLSKLWRMTEATADDYNIISFFGDMRHSSVAGVCGVFANRYGMKWKWQTKWAFENRRKSISDFIMKCHVQACTTFCVTWIVTHWMRCRWTTAAIRICVCHSRITFSHGAEVIKLFTFVNPSNDLWAFLCARICFDVILIRVFCAFLLFYFSIFLRCFVSFSLLGPVFGCLSTSSTVLHIGNVRSDNSQTIIW